MVRDLSIVSPSLTGVFIGGVITIFSLNVRTFSLLGEKGEGVSLSMYVALTYIPVGGLC